MKIGVLNGPNLNRLGKREPDIYGSETLTDLEVMLEAKAKELGVHVEHYQSNHEGDLIEKLYHWTDNGYSGVVVNVAAYTHSSIALRDAISASGLPVVEVHISNVHAREVFRHTSLIAPVAKAVIAGCGLQGYLYAMDYLCLKQSKSKKKAKG